MDELEFIQVIAQKSRTSKDVLLGIGDDAAVVVGRGPIIMTTDMLIDQVHFDTSVHDPKLIGRKALAVNLSDIAAMGGSATWALVSLAIPSATLNSLGIYIMDGILELAQEYGVAVIGGDTNCSKQSPLVISVTACGTPHERGVITRSGAKIGDHIYVTGPLGGSYHKGRHLSFTPRLRECKRLLDQVPISSMMDLSDGLATDLRKLVKASRVAAVIDPSRIPLHADCSTLLEALGDGEDFELCFTLDKAYHKEVCDALPVYHIGYIKAADPDCDIYFTDGSIIPHAGYIHQ